MKKFLKIAIVTILTIPAFGAEIVHKQAGKCLAAEGGVKDGSKVIAFDCTGAANESFVIEGGRLKIAGTGWCAQAETRNEGSEVRLKKCMAGDEGHKLQNFAFNGQTIGHNSGYCLDVKGGFRAQVASKVPWTNKPAVLAKCNGTSDQMWFSGTFKAGQNLQSIKEGTVFWVSGLAGMFEKKGSDIVAQDGVKIKSQIFAQGGGNIVTQSN